MTAQPPRAVPREGLAAPVFDQMGAENDLIVSLSFAPGLTDEQLRLAYRWLRAIERSPDRADPEVSPFATGEPFLHEYLFHARIGNLRDPRGAVTAFVDELTTAGARIRDSFFACWEWRPGGVMGPRRDPRAPREATGFGTARDYLDALWDPDAPPPASEVESELKGGLLSQDELILEHRGSPLYFPGVRIGYGTAPFTHSPADARTEQVRRTLVEALDEGWRTLFRAPGRSHVRPQPLGYDSGVDRVERILCGTRVGYLFSVEAVQLVDRPAPGNCRYREYELMEAVIDAIGRLGLAPVVTWRRYGTPVMIGPIRRPDTVEVQIWEPGGEHGSHAGLDRIAWLGRDGDGGRDDVPVQPGEWATGRS